MAKHLIGFANAEGGTIVLGLYDGAAEPRDLVHDGALNRLARAGSQMCEPPVRHSVRHVPHMAEGGAAQELIVIEVPPSELLHATTRDECYLRIGDSTCIQSRDQVQELALDKSVQRYEATRVPNATVDDLDNPLLENYADRLGSTRPISVLNDKTASEAPKLTVAAVLLFAQNPTRFFPNALVRVTRFRGKTRQAVLAGTWLPMR